MELTHFDENGKAVMVDVTGKAVTDRTAVAAGKITVNQAVYHAIETGTVEKGDVLGAAATAGIMAAKIEFEKNSERREILCYCTVKVTGKTGVEMEALTGVSIALLTIYDMCKALDKHMKIGEIYLLNKTGGKSDFNR